MVKNNIRSNWQKSNFARAAHFFCTFLCRCFARLQDETSRYFLQVTRFMEEMSNVFSFTFFQCCSFSPCILVATSSSRFVTVATRFSCRSSNKKCLLCFLSLALDLCRPFSSLSFADLPPTFYFFCLSLALYSKFVDMTIISLSFIL